MCIRCVYFYLLIINPPSFLQYYAKLGCSTQGGMKVYGYSDEYCTQEVNTNIGVYNDLKVSDPSCCDLLITLLTLNVVLNMFLIKLISLLRPVLT